MGVTESTFYLWKSKYKDFSEAIQRGKDTPDDQVENALLKRALGFREPATKAFNSNGTVIYGEYEEYYPPDTAAAFIWLKNRRPEKWRDRRELEHSGDINILADWIKDGEKGNPEKKLPGKT